MTLRPEYSLGHSEYNNFLFAAVGGEDTSGTVVTVLSALSRLGVDPWQEAARLSDLPRDAAARALAATFARLPEGGWKQADLGTIAASLVAFLPTHSAPAIPPTQGAPTVVAERKVMKAGFPAWLIWGTLAVAFYFLLMQMQPDRNLEPDSRRPTSQQ